jgi:hypothetical protein
MFSRRDEISRDELCLDYNSDSKNPEEKFNIYTRHCHGEGGNQKWLYENGMIKFPKMNGCLEMSSNGDSKQISVQPCSQNSTRQMWKWSKRLTKL